MNQLMKLLPLVALIGALSVGLGLFIIFKGITAQSSDRTDLQPSASETATEVVYDGSKGGVLLGELPSGKSAVIKHLGGKIITNNKTGYSSPIWGVTHAETDPYWVKRLPYKDMWNDAVYVQIGGQRVPFSKGQTTVTVKNDGWISTPVWLMMNDSQHFDNTGNARFSYQVR